MADKGMGFFGHKSGVVPFLVVYYQCSIHVGGQEEVLGSWEPFDLIDWRRIDDRLEFVIN